MASHDAAGSHAAPPAYKPVVVLSREAYELMARKAAVLDFVERERFSFSRPRKKGPHYYGNLTLLEALEAVMVVRKDEEREHARAELQKQGLVAEDKTEPFRWHHFIVKEQA